MNNGQATRGAEQLQAALARLAGPDRVVLQKRVGQAAVAQAQLGVRRGVDPYGKAWAPLTSRTGQPLRRTGNNIQRSWTASGETPTSFRFGSRFKYLATHQYGAIIRAKNGRFLRFGVESGWRLNGKGRAARGARGAIRATVYAQQVTIPRRQLVPEKDTGGLGAIWFEAFSRAVASFLRSRFGARVIWGRDETGGAA